MTNENMIEKIEIEKIKIYILERNIVLIKEDIKNMKDLLNSEIKNIDNKFEKMVIKNEFEKGKNIRLDKIKSIKKMISDSKKIINELGKNIF